MDVLSDVSNITSLPKQNLIDLSHKYNICICNDVLESLRSLSNTCELNIGIGTLIIKVEADSISYKFIPSYDLESNLIKTINTKESPLIYELEDNLSKKILNVYKELL